VGLESPILDEIDLELEENHEEYVGESPEENKNEVLEEKTEVISEDILDEPITETKTDIDEEDILSEENKNFETRDNIKKKKSPLLYLFVISIIALAAIGYYYLFMDRPASTFDENNNTQQITNEQTEEPNIKLNETESKTLTDNIEGKKSETKQSVLENQVNNNKIAGTNKASNQTEEEVAPNIYYNGSSYNVQVSSWKNKSVAQREVSKLSKRGFPAFIMKVYIPKFEGTWHRVRLGPFENLTEAKKAQSKIKK